MANLHEPDETAFVSGPELVHNVGGTCGRCVLSATFWSKLARNSDLAAVRRKFIAMGGYATEMPVLLLLLSGCDVFGNGDSGIAESPACAFVRRAAQCGCRASGFLCLCVLFRAYRKSARPF